MLQCLHHSSHTGGRRHAGGLLNKADDLFIATRALRKADGGAHLDDEIDPNLRHFLSRRLQLREHGHQILQRLRFRTIEKDIVEIHAFGHDLFHLDHRGVQLAPARVNAADTSSPAKHVRPLLSTGVVTFAAWYDAGHYTR
jgi:hypothetical protein